MSGRERVRITAALNWKGLVLKENPLYYFDFNSVGLNFSFGTGKFLHYY